MVSIDLDQQSPEGFLVASSTSLVQNSLDVQVEDQVKPMAPKAKMNKKSTNTDSRNSTESKKLSIVLSKEMHRRAKMQAVQEDTTLKDLVVRLIEKHLVQEQ